MSTSASFDFDAGLTPFLHSHVHSVMGAFGLNASILDSANLGWKLGLTCNKRAKVDVIMPTYEQERRRHGERIIEMTGTYLRFVCASNMPPVKLGGVGTEEREEGPIKVIDEDPTIEDPDKRHLNKFFANNMNFLLGIDCEYGHTVLTPTRNPANPLSLDNVQPDKATVVRWGVRAPNPRLSYHKDATGYLYDLLGRGSKLTVVLFGSDFQGTAGARVAKFAQHIAQPTSFAQRWSDLIDVVVLTKLLPVDLEEFLAQDSEEARAIKGLVESAARVGYDDELPGKDAHSVYGVNHAKGAAVVIRPDLWTGISVFPDEGHALDQYFGRFLL